MSVHITDRTRDNEMLDTSFLANAGSLYALRSCDKCGQHVVKESIFQTRGRSAMKYRSVCLDCIKKSNSIELSASTKKAVAKRIQFLANNS